MSMVGQSPSPCDKTLARWERDRGKKLLPREGEEMER